MHLFVTFDNSTFHSHVGSCGKEGWSPYVECQHSSHVMTQVSSSHMFCWPVFGIKNIPCDTFFLYASLAVLHNGLMVTVCRIILFCQKIKLADFIMGNV